MAEPNDDFDTALDAFDAALSDAADAQSAYDAASEALNAAHDAFQDARSDYDTAQGEYDEARDDALEAGDDLRDTVFTGLVTQGSALAAACATPNPATFGALGAAVIGYGVNLADANQEAQESREGLIDSLADMDDAIGAMADANDDIDAAHGDRLRASADLVRTDDAMNQALDDMLDALPGAPIEEPDHIAPERLPEPGMSVPDQPSAPEGVAGAEPPATPRPAGPNSDGEAPGVPDDLSVELSVPDSDPSQAPADGEAPASYASSDAWAEEDIAGWEAPARGDEPAAGEGMSCPDLGPTEDDVLPQSNYFDDDMFDDDAAGEPWDEDNADDELALSDADVDEAEEDE